MQLLQCKLDSAPQRFKRGGVGRERRFQAVLYGKQVRGDGLDRVLVGVRDLDRRPLADIFRLRLGSEPSVVVFLGFQLRAPQQLSVSGTAATSAGLAIGASGSTEVSPEGTCGR